MDTMAEFSEWISKADHETKAITDSLDSCEKGIAAVLPKQDLSAPPSKVTVQSPVVQRKSYPGRLIPAIKTSKKHHRNNDCDIIDPSDFQKVTMHEKSVEEEEETPSLCYTDTESSSSSSSLEELSVYSTHSTSTTSSLKRRSVHFNSDVEVREYKLAVGDHPMCEGALALCLDWDHTNEYYKDIELSKNRGMFYRSPRRLNQYQRRQRLIRVAGYTEDELDDMIVKDEVYSVSEDISILLGLLKRSISNFSLRALDTRVDDESDSDNDDC